MTDAISDSVSIEGKNVVLSYEGISLGKGELVEPLGLTVDTRGFVYAADGMAGKIYRYSIDGASVEFEEPTSYSSIYPMDIACIGSYIYVLDYTESRILRYDYRGAYLDVLISFQDTDYNHPTSITVAFDGRFIITDSYNHRVTIWSPLMDFQMELGGFEWGEEGLLSPYKALMLRDGRLVVLDSQEKGLKYFSASGALEKSVSLTEELGFLSPRYICTDRYNNVYVADPQARRVFVVSNSGAVSFILDSGDSEPIAPSAVAVDWNDNLFVADLKSHSILVYKISYTDR